jgi:hypothetical protein
MLHQKHVMLTRSSAFHASLKYAFGLSFTSACIAACYGMVRATARNVPLACVHRRVRACVHRRVRACVRACVRLPCVAQRGAARGHAGRQVRYVGPSFGQRAQSVKMAQAV